MSSVRELKSDLKKVNLKLLATGCAAVSIFIIIAVLGSLGVVAFSRVENVGASVEIIAGVSSELRSFISDTTLVVTSCTNQSIATTNTAVTGKVSIAHGCPVITDRQCVESVCTSTGVCEEVTTPGMECSLDVQCASTLGSDYGCNTTSCSCYMKTPANGTAATNGLACMGGIVVISDSTCPLAGQVLTAIDNQTADWQTPANILGVDVFINASITVGQILIIEVENTTAVWKDPTDAGIVTLDDTQTLTNKTLIAPIIQTISNVGTLTLPTATGTLVLEEVATGTATFSGIWASPRTAAFRLSKLSHQVLMWLEAMGTATTNANASIVSDAFIPAAFRPISNTVGYMAVTSAGVVGWVFGLVNADGTMTITGTGAGGNFTSGGSCGVAVGSDQIFRWYT